MCHWKNVSRFDKDQTTEGGPRKENWLQEPGQPRLTNTSGLCGQGLFNKRATGNQSAEKLYVGLTEKCLNT